VKTVEIATPISELLDNSQVSSKILKISDCFECREKTLHVKYPNQYLIHFDINIIHPWYADRKEFVKLAISSKPELKLITFHMATSYYDPPIENGMFQPKGKSFSRKELIMNAKKNIEWLRCVIAENVTIGVENNNYYPTEAYRHVTDGGFISQIVIDNDIKFLFDIAHAKITAHNKLIDYDKYLSSLPLDRAIQIHICSHKINKDNTAIDVHDLPGEDVLRESKSIIKKTPIKYLTVEYYKDENNLVDVLKKCRLLLKDIC
jgi:Protein of unknown function (DUF692)